MSRRLRVMTIAAGMLISSACFSQTPEEVLRRATLFGNARWLTLAISMELKGATGTRERGLEVFIARDSGATRILVHMVSPAFLSRMKFLTHRSASGETSSWLRTSQGVRKLSRANAAERIFDSDFTVEDFTEIDLDGFATLLLPDVLIGQVPCKAVQLTPGFRAQYARKVFFVEMNSGSLQGIDFFDTRDALVRQYRLMQTRMIDGTPFPSVSVMRDLLAQTETRLTVREIDTTTALPDKTFNKGNL